MKRFDRAAKDVAALVATFQVNEATYLASAYLEQAARKDFIDKFFIALGWDVNHDHQKNPFAQEVKIEESVKTGPAKRRADYAFSLAPRFGDIRFFVEAKKPQVDIATADNYFQAIRYAWNRHLPLVVLTDFHSLHVIDSRFKPDIDTALNRCVFKFHYLDYLDTDKFAKIYFLFSHEGISTNELENFAATMPAPKGKAKQFTLFKGGYQSIDDAFLEQLDEYRLALAKSFKKKNPQLDGDSLTEIVQRTLDRLVFLRFLEDKLIEPQPHIAHFREKGAPWKDFISTSRHLDSIYNGIVFKRHAILDSPSLQIEEQVFIDICDNLSDPNSPYDFNSIPVSILGSIYERFLGQVIVTTAKTASVEEKEEVRKAGGVYYTPEYVVRYIVDNTVGKLIDGKSPDAISKLKFGDISCGSGSFLISVYDHLLKYHQSYYNANPKSVKKGDVIVQDGYLHLSLKKKREILLSNIFGVDIDPQAVEVAQLSLYLKLLEDETIASASNYQHEIRQAILPPMSANIVCGNSLIDMDVLEGELFGEDQQRELNPLSFESRFQAIFKTGGFDAIVGNPPYVRPHRMSPTTKQYLWKKLLTFRAKSDLYSCFIERSLALLKDGGSLSFIVPHTWVSLESFQEIRKRLYEQSAVEKLVQLPKKVFKDATVETCIFVVRKVLRGAPAKHRIAVEKIALDTSIAQVRIFPQSDIPKGHLYNFPLYASNSDEQLKRKIKSMSVPLETLVEFKYGFKTADDNQFIAETRKYKESQPFIRSGAISRYHHEAPKEYVWYVPDRMTANRSTARPGEAARFESEKIIVARMGKAIACCYDNGGLYVKDAMLLLSNESMTPLTCLLGILNSRLIEYTYKKYFVTIDVLKNALLALPIVLPKAKAEIQEISKLALCLQETKTKAIEATTDRNREFYEGQFMQLDHKLNALVYKLYQLNNEEIEAIERTYSE